MLDPALVSSIAQIVGEDHVLAEEPDLDHYSGDALSPSRAFRASHLLEKTADLVVAPSSAKQVAEVVKLAAESGTPIVPRGGGTGVMGAALPVQGGIVLDLKRLNTILDIDPQSRMVRVEAGAVLEDVNTALHEHGLMLGHDPWSVPIATIGGTISTNGVGYLAAANGPMGEQVLGLEAVLPTGQVLSTPPVSKYSAGPNLNHLFIGAEGVFGVITQASLRVAVVPETRRFISFRFPTFDQGFIAVTEACSLGLRPTLMDLTEEGADGPILYLMFQGYRELVQTEISRCQQLCTQHEGQDLGPGPTEEYWEQRYDIALDYRDEVQHLPRKERWKRRRWGFDYLHMALPASRVLEYRKRASDLLSQQGIEVREYAIWGRPELFSMLVRPTSNRLNSAKFADAVDDVLRLAQDMGGTMEYCHGTGIKLAHLLAREWGVGLDVVRAMKQALDPANIMNPGKLGL